MQSLPHSSYACLRRPEREHHDGPSPAHAGAKRRNKEAREKAARAKSAKAGAAAHRALLAMQPRQASEDAAAVDAGAAANARAAGAAGAGGAHGTGDADADADGATAAGTTAVGVVNADGEAMAVHYFLSAARDEVRCV